MLVHGVRGDPLPEVLSNEELEVYGVDWEALHDDQLLQSQRRNNALNEGWSSWVGQTGRPEHLNDVNVSPPSGPLLQQDELEFFNQPLISLMHGGEAADVIDLWTLGLARAQIMYNI